MKYFSFILIITSYIICFANTDDFNLPPLDLRQGQLVSGNLLNVIILPYDGKTVFYIIGREAAEVSLNKLQIKFKPTNKENEESVFLKKGFGGFVYPGQININESKLQISAPNIEPETIYLKGSP